MTFLETWCFSIVVMVGAVAALWLHALAEEPSHTNIVVSFLGWGALGATTALVARALRTGMKLRDACERAASGVAKAPDDPTGNLLGKSWWQVPSVFVAAGGLAWWLIEQVGANRLYTGGP